ncbi:MAG: hydantoinase/oxoprolinase family protein [Planctomycetes bacterium]|nr:hydantoinase/oxoprolinase family protein [Planctomycetota bacterium]
MIAIDTGGTFTDFVRWSESTGLRIHKERSTPDDPAASILQGLAVLDPEGEEPVVVYGTTLATNALLTRSGANVCVLTTAGFEDVLEIGRQARPRLYDLHPVRPAPLVPADRRLGVDERIDTAGKVLRPLRRAEVERALDRVKTLGADSVAVCLLNAFASPRHERMAARLARARGFDTSVSHEVLNEFREYDRFTATVMNAFTSPLLGRFLARLERAIAGATRPRRRLWVIQSDGGMLPPALAARFAVRTVLSGPAGGVTGAVQVARRADSTGRAGRRLIAFDMGGTSTDVSLTTGSVPLMTEGSFEGFPLRVPMVDVHSVGAGGGSIARVGADGRLRVGPESAGADPGPACYGRGEELTVTDANLLLGRLDPRGLLDGTCPLDAARAARLLARLARKLGLSPEAAAEGIVRVANARMEAAIRAVSIERGHDPRGFALLAFGGCGGLHACALASALGIRDVLVPPHPGVFSAFGMLHAPVSRTYSESVLAPWGPGLAPRTEASFRAMETRARAELLGRRASTVAGRELRFERGADLRYQGQSFELAVPYGARLERDFHAAHRRAYGYADPARPIEVVTLRLRASEPRAKAGPRPAAPTHRPRTARHAEAAGRVYESGRWRPCLHIRRETMPNGRRVAGPALVLEYSATTYLPAGWNARIDTAGNLRLREGK